MNELNSKTKYTGYLWMSNKTEPDIYENQELTEVLSESKNPFVVEGQLYDPISRSSYSIKYVDGKHIVVKYDLSELEQKYGKEKCVAYRSNRMQGRKLYFIQYWNKEKDELCEDMEVMKPAEQVFVGFKLMED